MSTLGVLVKSLRMARGLSQADVADQVGIVQTYVSDIEAGKRKLPTIHHRRRLAAALGTGNVDLLLAAGEVEEAELAAWAREQGFVRPGLVGDEASLIGVIGDLAMEDPDSPRVGLARRIPDMTRQEAAYVTEMFERLPTEAQAKRRTLTPQEYRRWRDHQDVKVEV
ncbi:MAG: helix-turn-helix domain-containing protein [Chloroflexota bacterium]|nr:helix-turn-helix domain-containing protein [Chloroflexota bacterium]